jgi:hypothetical protein
MIEKLEHLKARVRAKAEHPFDVIKNLFRHRKTRYRGLAKNTAQLFTLFGFANLILAGQRFNVTETRVVPLAPKGNRNTANLPKKLAYRLRKYGIETA